ncbi:hypothetical protein [Cylindrospermopsis raciborskii]|uniref:Uncharacterized protein n=1 Tax=Cylindrospermopsis raciborskii CENA302 TaxID=1170768 RepID=A0A9Q5QVM9_9CYAN|nr:hypothetical protein [Cylindrospermopsis raciborskii]NLQ04101.1 hypothetical protein [Cylindrospermopsis raciborskii MVCC19]OHY31718.1 hypothetical protein BCV64_14495 [Cylindrospermopsis raciborskii MVCC14]OPH09217.1 hypothetical protein CENA302_12765 [Cylindrospermopsis raciborskii CENA302]
MRILWALLPTTLIALNAGDLLAQERFAGDFSGDLKIGKTHSYVFYFGKESGDTVIYFFETQSPVGKKITRVCKQNTLCRGKAQLQVVKSIPKSIPESTSGTYKIISVSQVNGKR